MTVHKLDLGTSDVSQPAALAPAPAKKRRRRKKGGRLHIRADISHGGGLSVRHHIMSFQGREQVIKLGGVELSDDGGKAVWIQLAKPGLFKGHPAGPFELNARVFSEIVANFHATENRRIAIDYEHASEADPTSGGIPVHGAPAQGWIVDMKIEGGHLWGLVEWLPQAREQIKSGAYRFFSPAIRFNAVDRVTAKPIGARMTSGALTNGPYLDGLQPLAAKDVTDAMALLTDLGFLEDDTETETTGSAAPEAPTTETIMTEKLLAEKNLELTDAKTKLAEFGLNLKDVTARAEKAEAEVKLLSDKLAAHDEAARKARVEDAFETYKDEKKLTDDDRDGMLVVLTAKPETFEKMYPKVRGSEQHLLRDLSKDPANKKPPVVVEEKPISLRDAAIALSRAKGIPLAKAQEMVLRAPKTA